MSWEPNAALLVDRPQLVVARRDPVAPVHRDEARLFATRVVEAAACHDDGVDAAVDFALPDSVARYSHLVRFRDDDEPIVRRSLGDVLALRAEGSELGWAHFSRINLRFAARVAGLAAPGATALIVADGLYLTPRQLRRLRLDMSIVFVVLEELPLIQTVVRSPAGVQVMSGMLGADVVWFATPAEASRFAMAAVALDLAEPAGGAIVHLGRAIELRTG